MFIIFKMIFNIPACIQFETLTDIWNYSIPHSQIPTNFHAILFIYLYISFYHI